MFLRTLTSALARTRQIVIIRPLGLLVTCSAISLLYALLAAAGESSAGADRYFGVRFPNYKDGRLVSELRAKEADALDIGENQSEVHMKEVRIDIYDTSIATGDPTAPGGSNPEPRLKMRVVADTGTYTKQKNEDGVLEGIAILKQNVRTYRYAYAAGLNGEVKRSLQTTVVCDNATWNHSRQVLHGKGPVKVTQPDSTLNGTDFVYYPRRDAAAGTGQSGTNTGGENDESGNGLGGWIEVHRDVEMVLYRGAAQRILHDSDDAPPPAPPSVDRDEESANRTVVTCAGLASYDLDTREMQFQKQVVVTQPQMTIQSDFLRVQIARDGAEQQMREIIAWSNVTINGRQIQEGTPAEEAESYVAHGDYARYTGTDEKIVLTDRREGKKPIVRSGNDMISDRLITLHAAGDRMSILAASGGEGQTVFRVAVEDTVREDGKHEQLTIVTYTGKMRYDIVAGRAIFTTNTRLEREGLILEADALQIDMVPEGAGAPPTSATQRGIKTVVATNNVVITQGQRISRATRAELEVASREVRLFGPPQPQVEEANLFSFGATTIRSVQTQRTSADEEPLNYMEADGPGSGVFRTRQQGTDQAQAEEEENRIRFKEKMKYDETGRHFRFPGSDDTHPVVRFTGDVVSISPDYVLHSQILDVILNVVEFVGDDGQPDTRREVSAVSAHGEATLHWGDRHCAGSRIVRDMRKQVVIVYGDKEASKNAEVWEEVGNRFEAPLIVATADGQQVHAQGPGILTLPDDGNEKKARVHYEGTAVFSRISPREDKVIFTKNVKMVREGMTVTGDHMIAYLVEDPDAERAADWATQHPDGKTSNPRRLDRVEVRGTVVVTQPQRVAVGAWGQVLARPAGDIISLRGNDKRDADIRDQDGVHLISPSMVANQGRGIVTAKGPGRVYIMSDDPQLNAGQPKPDRYLLEFREKMVYNSLSRKLRFYRNVRLKQSNVNGQCDELELVLEEKEEASTPGSGQLSQAKVKEMFAYGDATFQRFEPLAAASTAMDRANMPGKTIFTKSDRAHYDLTRRVITLMGGPPRPTAIEQVTKVGGGGRLERDRTQMWADTLIMDVRDGTMTGSKARVKRQNVSSEGGIVFRGE